MRWLAAAVVALLAPGVAVAATVRITARIAPSAPQVRGTVETTITNKTARPLDAVALVLFPNRFATPDRNVDDVNRAFVYPYEEFDPGRMTVADVAVNGTAVAVAPMQQANVPDGCLVRVPLPAPLGPGRSATLRARFETIVPTRFGTFGTFEGMITAVGGWYPWVGAPRDDGRVDASPALADYDVALDVDPSLELVVNGRHFDRGAAPLHVALPGVHYASLIAAPRLDRDQIDVDGTRVELLQRPPVRTDRKAFGPTQREITLAALRHVVASRPATVPGRDALVVVEAPLRWTMSAPGEGMVVLSDRALKVFPALRPFHEVQVAQAVYAELLRPPLAAREPAADFPWVDEALAHEAALHFRDTAQPRTRSVQDWIELFNVFAIVDRFESAPKIPFVAAFFERAPEADPLHDQVTTFDNDLPPGHVILGKLRQRLGDTAFDRLVARCAAGATPFRTCAGADQASFFAEWLQPYPAIDYDFAGTTLNAPAGDGYASTVTVRRRASREVHEPVDVELRTRSGEPARLRWDGSDDEGRLTATTAGPVRQAVIDPDRKLIETTRANDARPPSPQLVFDSAEVEVSSTEFGVSALMVGRERYDYRKDVAAAGFYTNRSVGVDVGPRFHWGTPNDPTLYRQNLFLFWDAQKLDSTFEENRRRDVHTPGHLSGVGLRYGYNDIVAFDNPTHSVDFRLFGDAFDESVGSTYDYADWGASLVVTRPLLTHRTIVAGQVLNGFSEAFHGSVVPLQGRFSLGGERSIRGIGAEDELARNIFLVRTELRQMVYPELDLNLLDLLVLRRAQMRFFVDTGRVSNSAGAVYDPGRYAVGAGVGFAAVYDFMGFFPSIAYVEIATRVDRNPSDVQFLFGTRQSF